MHWNARRSFKNKPYSYSDSVFVHFRLGSCCNPCYTSSWSACFPWTAVNVATWLSVLSLKYWISSFGACPLEQPSHCQSAVTSQNSSLPMITYQTHQTAICVFSIRLHRGCTIFAILRMDGFLDCVNQIQLISWHLLGSLSSQTQLLQSSAIYIMLELHPCMKHPSSFSFARSGHSCATSLLEHPKQSGPTQILKPKKECKHMQQLPKTRLEAGWQSLGFIMLQGPLSPCAI